MFPTVIVRESLELKNSHCHTTFVVFFLLPFTAGLLFGSLALGRAKRHMQRVHVIATDFLKALEPKATIFPL